MPVVRGSDADGVDVFIVVNLAQVFHHLHLPAVLRLELTGPLGQNVLIHVAQRDDLNIGQLRETGNVIGAAPIHANNSHANPVIRTKRVRRNQGWHTQHG